MSADHLVKVASGHLEMSRSWIIKQEEPRGKFHPTRWRPAHRRREGLASLTVGIMSAPVYTRVPDRLSADGAALPDFPGHARLASGVMNPALVVSTPAVRFGALLSLALAILASSA